MDRYQKLSAQKAKSKKDILGEKTSARTPVLLVDLAHVPTDDEQTRDLLKGLESLNIEILAVNASAQDRETSIGNVHYMNGNLKTAALKAADFVLSYDEDVGEIWTEGCVPVAQSNGNGTINYNPLQEKGNGFYFKSPAKWEVFAAVVRALETYQFPYDWDNLVREILKK